MKNTWCVGGRQYSNINSITQYEKRNPKTKKLVKIIERKCDIRGRNKRSVFSKK